MSEKFSLKWNDFQTTVSKSFGVLRQEKEFLDVTLVSDDETQISAHKLVLSACSGFFKSILKNNSHSHPLLYLSGIHSTNLSLVLDYIYQGEVQIYQEHLDSFLEVAQKLKIEGLITNDENTEEKFHQSFYNEEIDIDHNTTEAEHKQNVNERNVSMNKHKKERTIAVNSNDNSGVEDKIEEILSREDGAYLCTVCGYKNKNKQDITRHIETHIEGLSYSCSYCQKTFRSRNSLRNHQSKYHK